MLGVRPWQGPLLGVVVAGLISFGVGCTSAQPKRSSPEAVASTSAQTVRDAVLRWRRAGGVARIDAIAADFATMGAGTSSDAVLAAGCRHLLADVGIAKSYARIPDVTAEDLWARALDMYAFGASDCVRGADAHDYAAVMQASREFDRATADIKSLNDRLNTVSGP